MRFYPEALGAAAGAPVLRAGADASPSRARTVIAVGLRGRSEPARAPTSFFLDPRPARGLVGDGRLPPRGRCPPAAVAASRCCASCPGPCATTWCSTASCPSRCRTRRPTECSTTTRRNDGRYPWAWRPIRPRDKDLLPPPLNAVRPEWRRLGRTARSSTSRSIPPRCPRRSGGTAWATWNLHRPSTGPLACRRGPLYAGSGLLAASRRGAGGARGSFASPAHLRPVVPAVAAPWRRRSSSPPREHCATGSRWSHDRGARRRYSQPRLRKKASIPTSRATHPPDDHPEGARVRPSPGTPTFMPQMLATSVSGRTTTLNAVSTRRTSLTRWEITDSLVSSSASTTSL